MAVTNQRKRNWIRRLFDKSVEQGVSFADQLAAERNAAVDANLSGDIGSFSGNGVSTTFAQSGMSPGEAEELVGSIEDLYAAAVSDLANQSTPITSPTDTQIRDVMLLLIGRKVTTLYNDYSGLRP